MIDLNYINVLHQDKAIFIPLPRELWKTALGGCSCAKCFGTGYYDTLAVSKEEDKQGQRNYTWMVHYPELQPLSVRRALEAEAAAAVAS